MSTSIYEYLASKHVIVWYLSIALFLSVVIVTWQRLFLTPWSLKRTYYITEIATLRQQARMIQENAAITQETKKTSGNQCLSINLDQCDIDQTVDTLCAQAARRSIVVKNGIIQEAKKKDGYTVQHILLNMTGNFEPIQHFFEDIAASGCGIRCGALRLEKQHGKMEHDGELVCNCTMRLYTFDNATSDQCLPGEDA